jgi:hypothetical protein
MTAVESPILIDTNLLSSFLSIDTPDIQSIINSAAEGVLLLLRQVQVKANEYEEITNAKTILEISVGTFK